MTQQPGDNTMCTLTERELLDAERAILDAFVDYKRLPVFLDIAANALGSPFFFCDLGNNLVATSSDTGTGDDRWSAILERRYFDLREVLRGPETLHMSTDGNGVTLAEFKDGGMVVFSDVRVEKTPIGCVGSVGCFPHDDPALSDFVRFMGRIVSAQMSKSEYYRSGKHDVYESFFRNILKGSVIPEFLDTRMEVLGISFLDKLEVLLVKPEGRDDFGTVGETKIRRDIESLFGTCHSLVHDRSLLFIIESRSTALNSDRPELASLAEYLRERGLIGGLSNPFSDIGRLRIFCEQAEKAIFYAKDIRKNAKPLNLFEDYIVDYLLEFCAGHFDLRDYRHPAIATLLNYDEKMKTDYLETLRVYLYCAGNMAKTAQELGVHYNTVKYRIQCIEHIASISLKDAVTIMTLTMELRILGGHFRENG